MRLLVVTHNYPRFPDDPAGAFVARLARASLEAGVRARVIVPRAAGYSVDPPDPVPVERFRYAPRWLTRVGYRGGPGARLLLEPRTLLALPLFLRGFRGAVRRAVASFRPHVIHAHWWAPAGWAARGHGPMIVTCHGTDIRLAARFGPLRPVARRVFHAARAVTVVSRFLSQDLHRLMPEIGSVAVTPMPVDVGLFSRGREVVRSAPPRILYAGNLVESKGVDVLLRAFAVLVDGGFDCALRIVGEGAAERGLRRLARTLGVVDRVSWSPFRPHTDMPDEYGAATVTALPSRGEQEGLGLVLVEALLAGSAVVGAPAGGIRDVIEHEVTGLLARDGDVADLARQLERVLTDRALRDRLTKAGRARVLMTHDPRRCAERFLELYDAVAARSAG